MKYPDDTTKILSAAANNQHNQINKLIKKKKKVYAKMETEITVMQFTNQGPPRSARSRQKLERGVEQSPGGTSRTAREQVSVISSHQVGGYLLC